MSDFPSEKMKALTELNLCEPRLGLLSQCTHYRNRTRHFGTDLEERTKHVVDPITVQIKPLVVMIPRRRQGRNVKV